MPLSLPGVALGGSALSFAGGILANKEAARSAAKSIDFQREMAKNAHQYEVADLRAAGLNPIISALGKGASASGGAQYRPENILKEAAASALAIVRTKAEIDQIKAQTVKTTHEGKINEVGATIADKLLNSLGAPFSSAIDAAKQGYQDIGTFFKRMPSAIQTQKIIAKDRLKDPRKKKRKKPLTIQIEKSSTDY